MYDFEKLCVDYDIEFKPINSRGFIQIQCPYCNDNKFKGGLHCENGIFVCWSCSWQPLYKTIKILTGENWKDIELNYKTNLNYREKYLIDVTEKQKRPEKLLLPEGTTKLNERAKKYLIERNFDIQELEEVYDLRSTGHIGDYNFRVIIPIYFENKLISYTARDYTGKSPIRYYSCKGDKEIIPHKDIVYAYDLVPDSHAVCCEGPFDSMKLGPGAVATFGIAFRQQQINLLASFFKITLLYDSSDDAQKAADKLGDQLSGLGVEVDSITLKDYKDPGEMPLNEARQFMKEILDGV